MNANVQNTGHHGLWSQERASSASVMGGRASHWCPARDNNPSGPAASRARAGDFRQQCARTGNFERRVGRRRSRRLAVLFARSTVGGNLKIRELAQPIMRIELRRVPMIIQSMIRRAAIHLGAGHRSTRKPGGPALLGLPDVRRTAACHEHLKGYWLSARARSGCFSLAKTRGSGFLARSFAFVVPEGQRDGTRFHRSSTVTRRLGSRVSEKAGMSADDRDRLPSNRRIGARRACGSDETRRTQIMVEHANHTLAARVVLSAQKSRRPPSPGRWRPSSEGPGRLRTARTFRRLTLFRQVVTCRPLLPYGHGYEDRGSGPCPEIGGRMGPPAAKGGRACKYAAPRAVSGY